MKRADFTPCIQCGERVGKANGLMFYQVTLQRMMFDHRAIQMTAGLELMLRSPAIAEVFAPDPEYAKPLGEPEKFLLCDDCATDHVCVAQLSEDAANRRNTDAGDDEPTAAATPNDPPTGEAA